MKYLNYIFARIIIFISGRYLLSIFILKISVLFVIKRIYNLMYTDNYISFLFVSFFFYNYKKLNYYHFIIFFVNV